MCLLLDRHPLISKQPSPRCKYPFRYSYLNHLESAKTLGASHKQSTYRYHPRRTGLLGGSRWFTVTIWWPFEPNQPPAMMLIQEVAPEVGVFCNTSWVRHWLSVTAAAWAMLGVNFAEDIGLDGWYSNGSLKIRTSKCQSPNHHQTLIFLCKPGHKPNWLRPLVSIGHCRTKLRSGSLLPRSQSTVAAEKFSLPLATVPSRVLGKQ